MSASSDAKGVWQEIQSFHEVLKLLCEHPVLVEELPFIGDSEKLKIRDGVIYVLESEDQKRRIKIGTHSMWTQYGGIGNTKYVETENPRWYLFQEKK